MSENAILLLGLLAFMSIGLICLAAIIIADFYFDYRRELNSRKP